MSFSLLEDFEKLGRISQIAILPSIINLLGFNCLLHRVIKDITDEVYGIYSGNSTTSQVGIIPIKVLMSGMTWRIICQHEGGYLDDTGFMYTQAPVINDDIISVIRDDSKTISFKIVDTETVGISTTIFNKFKLSNTGE